jgi:PadR family transcriptional regulator PadR
MARKVKEHSSRSEEPEDVPPPPSPDDSAAGGFAPFLSPPRDLLTAYLLLLLRNWSMHGYQLMQQLIMFGYQASDPGSIYRQLRQLEKRGFITSNWEAGEAGPARRTYTLTEAGDAFLNTWASAIEQYQKTLKFWSDVYSGLVTPPRRDG